MNLKYFEFKKYPQDFIVEEKLRDNNVCEGGHVFYVFFEKKNKNTFDILKYLWKQLNLKRKHFWIAWLKDKFWITRQWISIYKRTLNSRWGTDKFLKILWKQAKILKVCWGNKLLKVWDNKWNLFFLRLRLKDKQLFNNDFKIAVEKALEYMKTNWVPNYFGEQRFWKKYSNPKIWKKIILGEKKIKDPLEAQFKVQAYASYLFNLYLDLRIKSWYFDKLLKWDILKKYATKDDIYKYYEWESTISSDFIPTWPVYGYNLVVGWDFIEKNWIITKFTELTPALKLELEILNKEWLTVNVLHNFKQYKVFWIRRWIKVFLEDLRYKWTEQADLLVMFELPSWSYASVVVKYLDQLVDKFIQKQYN